MIAAFGSGSLLSAAGSLFIILGLLAAFWFAARKLRGARGVQRNARPAPINIIATRGLGVQSALLIVEAEGQRFLIGTSRAGITAIGALAPSGTATAESFVPLFDRAAAMQGEIRTP